MTGFGDGSRGRIFREHALSAWLLAFVAIATTLAAAQEPASAGSPSERSDERLQFYPGTARAGASGRLLLRVEAWAYETETRPGLRTLLARYLKIDRDALSAEDRARYDERTQLFRFDSERGKALYIVGGDGARLPLPRTRSDGRSGAELSIAAAPPRDGLWFSFQGALSERAGRSPHPLSSGRALWVPESGISLVSDIDDTIKHTNVLVRREMLLNTFVRPFKAVGGMAARYRAFAESKPDLRVHYVSGGPHQLYPALAEFLESGGFPPGSVHMRDVSIRKEVFGEDGGTRAHKLATIRRLIADFPKRRFVLIGDSGEQDPEIYATLVRKHPNHVLAIWIRDVTEQPRAHPRYARAFAGIDPARWHLFDDSARIELPGDLR